MLTACFAFCEAAGGYARFDADREAAHESAVEASPVGPTLLAFVDRAGGEWSGTASELLGELDSDEIAGDRARRQRIWPASGRGLSGQIRRIAGDLRALGIEVTFTHQGSGRARIIGLKRVDGPRTLNARRTALRSFARWCVRHGRLTTDPLAAVSAAHEGADRRRTRRALSLDELERLTETTHRGPQRAGISGEDRAMLYRVMAATGLRRSEAASLKPKRFDLVSDPPTATVETAYSKRRRDDVQPLPRRLADQLRPWLTDKRLGRPLWPLPDKPCQRLLKPDLEAAGIAERDDAGRVVDFHSFRHGYVTRLVGSGAPVSVAQRLARHSTPILTLGVYSQVELADERAALAKAFESGTPCIEEKPAALRMTGTDKAEGAPNAHQRVRSEAPSDAPVRTALGANVIVQKGMDSSEKLDTNAQACAGVRAGARNAPRRTRTSNPLIKSQETIPPTSAFGPISGEQAPNAHHGDSQGQDHDLECVVRAWPELPPSLREAILAIVKAAASGGAD